MKSNGGKMFLTIPQQQWCVVNQSLCVWLPSKEWDEVKPYQASLGFYLRTSPSGLVGEELTVPPGLTSGHGSHDPTPRESPGRMIFELPLKTMPQHLVNKLRHFGRRLGWDFLDALK